MPIRHGQALWPGAIAVESCTYTLSHGISPGVALLRTLPQEAAPAMVGALTITDGEEGVILHDCKVDAVRVDRDSGGTTWSLTIFDRRWKWKNLGEISGAYNQLDPHGKLIPWTIRSPRELAELCLQAMGETGYTIDMPDGITRDQALAAFGQNPPWIGVTPTTGTNPPVNWDHEPPAQALANLCELFGRRVVLQLATNAVLIVIPGRGGSGSAAGSVPGGSLPSGSIARESPSIDSPETPTGVTVVGSPTRYQCRLLLEAVGEEWDGSFRRINELSYAPRSDGRVQISKATAFSGGNSNTYQCFIGYVEDPPTTGAMFETTTNNATTAATNLAAAINASADPRVAGKVTATAALGVLTVTGIQIGFSFSFWAKMSGAVSGTAYFVAESVQSAEFGTVNWEHCPPKTFPDVRATDRLTYTEALSLAQKHIYRTYRLADKNVTGQGRIRIPGFGLLSRRQQIILEPTQVEQVEPQPLDQNLVDAEGRPIILNFYNGYSRDKPAACYGRMVLTGSETAFWVPSIGQSHTNPADQMFVDFSIDPEKQLVTFATHVYTMTGDRYFPATPILQTGVLVRHAETNEIDAYKASRILPGMSGITNHFVQKRPDVQLNVIGEYNDANVVTGTRLLEQDAIVRANFYLDGMELQYPVAGGLTREYNGIRAIDCDGAVCQVTWEVGPNGASTVASLDSEHSVYVPPFPARRRAEFLASIQQQAAAEAGRIGAALMNAGPLGGFLGRQA